MAWLPISKSENCLFQGCADSVTVISMENEISELSSNSDQFCFIPFALMPLVKAWINLQL